MADELIPRIGDISGPKPLPEDSKSTCYCSFCGNSQNAAKLIAGPTVFICEECVDVCLDILKKGYTPNKQIASFFFNTRHPKVWDSLGISACLLLRETFIAGGSPPTHLTVAEMLERLGATASWLIEEKLGVDQIDGEIRKAKAAVSELNLQAGSAREVLRRHEDAVRNLKRLRTRRRNLGTKSKAVKKERTDV